LVVGDVTYDLVLNGTMRDTAAAPVFSGSSRLESLGGAADAATRLAALGNEVCLIGTVGADASGRRAREMLREQGIVDTFVLEDLSRPTMQRTYLVAEGRQVLCMDRESRAPLSAPLVNRLLECVDALLPQVDAIVCANGDKRVCAPELIDPLLTAVRSTGCPIFVDDVDQSSDLYREVTEACAQAESLG
jgi:D-beta-D-heptose 7-phosphate kinase/D-beta-D-heptose 1-phosphate adenosyltransferase